MTGGVTADLKLGMGAFEMQRMLRQNAHEKAFEIRVQEQRQFEKQKQQMIYEGNKKEQAEHDDRVKKLHRDYNIANSRSITNSRILKMQKRSEHIAELRDEMLNELKDLRVNDRERYLGTLKNLILQSMVRMLESEIHVKCREEDKEDIEAMIDDLQTQYSEFMAEKTGRDEYATTIHIFEDDFLTAAEDEDCGGVIVLNSEKTIVCKNMIVSRLKQTFEECLPAIRSSLFPGQR